MLCYLYNNYKDLEQEVSDLTKSSCVLFDLLPITELFEVLEQRKISFKSFRNFLPLMQYRKKFIPLLVG